MTHARRHRHPRRPGRNRPLLRWHRRLGLLLAAALALVAATGLGLNHAESLGLHRRPCDWDWLQARYGIEPTSAPFAARAGALELMGIEGAVFLEDRALPGSGPLLGAAAADSWVAVARGGGLVLLSSSGEVLEEIATAALPGGRPPQKIGRAGTALALASGEGPPLTSADGVSWEPLPPGISVAWSCPEPPSSPEAAARALRAWRGQILTWHRILLDLHTGRIFGAAGRWLADLAALGCLALVATGLVSALRRRRRSLQA